jgi:hypothetical protein
MSESYLSKEDIKEWMKEAKMQYAAHYGSGYAKSLEVTLAGEWLVFDHHHEIYRGDIDTAIDTYNSILPRK